MKTCPNCQTQTNETLCPACGADLHFAKQTKKGPFVRLVIFALFVAISVIGSIAAAVLLFKEGFVTGMTQTTSVLALALFASTLISAWIKWCVYILPKSFRVANKIASRLIALSILGLGIKMLLWTSALLFPVGIAGTILSTLINIASTFLVSSSLNLASAILFLIVSLLCCAAYALLELRSMDIVLVKSNAK